MTTITEYRASPGRMPQVAGDGDKLRGLGWVYWPRGQAISGAWVLRCPKERLRCGGCLSHVVGML